MISRIFEKLLRCLDKKMTTERRDTDLVTDTVPSFQNIMFEVNHRGIFSTQCNAYSSASISRGYYKLQKQSQEIAVSKNCL